MCYFHCDKKKLENICDFIWWHKIFFVPLHRQLRLTEQLHRGLARASLATGARGKQLAAPVLSYHRQGPFFEGELRGRQEEETRGQARERQEGEPRGKRDKRGSQGQARERQEGEPRASKRETRGRTKRQARERQEGEPRGKQERDKRESQGASKRAERESRVKKNRFQHL